MAIMNEKPDSRQTDLKAQTPLDQSGTAERSFNQVSIDKELTRTPLDGKLAFDPGVPDTVEIINKTREESKKVVGSSHVQSGQKPP